MGRVFLLPTLPTNDVCKTPTCNQTVRVVVPPEGQKKKLPVMRVCGHCDGITSFAPPKEPTP